MSLVFLESIALSLPLACCLLSVFNFLILRPYFSIRNISFK
jgi:hypothetical protein